MTDNEDLGDVTAEIRHEDPVAAMTRVADAQPEEEDIGGTEVPLAPDTADNQSAYLQNIITTAKNGSREAKIPNGKYYVAQPGRPGLELSFSDLHAEPPGQLSRPNIVGDGMGTTLISGNTPAQPSLKITGGRGIKAHDYISIKDLSFGNATGVTGNGMHINSSAFIRGESLGFFGKDTGLYLESVLSSEFSHMNFKSCRTGMYLATGSGFSGINAMRFARNDFGFCFRWGVHGINIQTNVTFDSCNFEGCGSDTDPSRMWMGGVALTFDGSQGSVGSNFVGCYFEANKGGFDVQLNNIGNHYVTHTFVGCNFNRVGNTSFVNNNIRSIGKNRIVLIGCTFDGYGGYQPSQWRTYFTDFSAGSPAEVTCIGCHFANRQEQGNLRNINPLTA